MAYRVTVTEEIQRKPIIELERLINTNLVCDFVRREFYGKKRYIAEANPGKYITNVSIPDQYAVLGKYKRQTQYETDSPHCEMKSVTCAHSHSTICVDNKYYYCSKEHMFEDLKFMPSSNL